jgi:hypothetical protein
MHGVMGASDETHGAGRPGFDQAGFIATNGEVTR